jgi:hypothetical protein
MFSHRTTTPKHLFRAPQISIGTSCWDMRRYSLGNAYREIQRGALTAGRRSLNTA